MKKPKVYVALYEHRHGHDMRVFDDWKKAQIWKDDIGDENWSRVSDDPQPEDPCGDEYFDLVSGEWFTIEQLEVE